MKTIPLNNKTNIPLLGFGTWHLSSQDCHKAVSAALKTGYRHIDCAPVYGNQKAVGKAIKESGISRKDLFITSKAWRIHLREEDLPRVLKETLRQLNTTYLDLYLIHWPNRRIPIKETLVAMQKLKDQGLIRAIGVSNFTINHLKSALKTKIEISNNQVEFHPSFNQKELKKFCDEQNIALTAYSPLAQGRDLKLPIIQKIAKKHNRFESQVILNWLRAKKIIAIPRSAKEKLIIDNFKSLEWELDPQEVKDIDNVKVNKRLLAPFFAEFNL